PTKVFDASLAVLGNLDHGVSRSGAFHGYIGSGERPAQDTPLAAWGRGGRTAKIRRLGAGPAEVEPGARAFVRVHLPVDVPLLPGDRFVLRESGRSETVGGGEVLDVAPVLSARRARRSSSVDRVVAERGWVEVGELERLTGERRPPVLG